MAATNKAYNDVLYIDGTAAPEVDPKRAGSERTLEVITPARKPKLGAFYIVLTTFSLVLLVLSCTFFISVHSEISQTEKDIIAEQSKLQTLKSANNAKEVYLNESIDLAEVYEKATSELGMVYPSDSQVIYYQRTESGYVKQNDEIPKN